MLRVAGPFSAPLLLDASRGLSLCGIRLLSEQSPSPPPSPARGEGVFKPAAGAPAKLLCGSNHMVSVVTPPPPPSRASRGRLGGGWVAVAVLTPSPPYPPLEGEGPFRLPPISHPSPFRQIRVRQRSRCDGRGAPPRSHPREAGPLLHAAARPRLEGEGAWTSPQKDPSPLMGEGREGGNAPGDVSMNDDCVLDRQTERSLSLDGRG